ncbi:MAG: hypothetical protein ACM3X7_11430 [Solirubrobacterales bacterium]
MINNKASNIAKGGFLTALGFLFIYLSSYIPTNRIFILSLAGCTIIISIIVSGTKYAMLVFASTAILSLLITGIRITTISYLIFFGTYGFAKYYIERLNNLIYEYILKYIFFNICLGIFFLLYKLVLPSLFTLNTSIYIVAGGAQLFFIVYDYALSLFISNFKKRYLKL